MNLAVKYFVQADGGAIKSGTWLCPGGTMDISRWWSRAQPPEPGRPLARVLKGRWTRHPSPALLPERDLLLVSPRWLSPLANIGCPFGTKNIAVVISYGETESHF
jgi:hypothetical protein